MSWASVRSSAEILRAKQLGARILGQANDLKRTLEALAAEMGVDLQLVQDIVGGIADLATTREFVWKLTQRYPVSFSDIWIEADDTDDGVLLMKGAHSEQSSRVVERRHADGTSGPYYEYRDTATSCLSPFKPEWIRQLRVVDNDDPYNPDVAFNNGHLPHQITFFIGTVNFYWEIDERRYSQPMNSGDSAYITPMVPHSFANRDARGRAVVIAVTYAAQVQCSLRDFEGVPGTEIDRVAGDLREMPGFALRLSRHMAAESVAPAELAAHLRANGVSAERAASLSRAHLDPDFHEYTLIADFLRVRPEDLIASRLDKTSEVVTRRRTETRPRGFPAGNNRAYDLWPLARSRHQPYLKGFEAVVLDAAEADRTFRHGLHTYVFNHGSVAVDLMWGDGRRDMLEPEDSAYIRAFVPHGFINTEPARRDRDQGHLVIIRVPGRLTDSVLDELATFPKNGRRRVGGEDRQWF